MSSDWVESFLVEYVERNSERKQYMMLSEGHSLIYTVNTQYVSV